MRYIKTLFCSLWFMSNVASATILNTGGFTYDASALHELVDFNYTVIAQLKFGVLDNIDELSFDTYPFPLPQENLSQDEKDFLLSYEMLLDALDNSDIVDPMYIIDIKHVKQLYHHSLYDYPHIAEQLQEYSETFAEHTHVSLELESYYLHSRLFAYQMYTQGLMDRQAARDLLAKITSLYRNNVIPKEERHKMLSGEKLDVHARFDDMPVDDENPDLGEDIVGHAKVHKKISIR